MATINDIDTTAAVSKYLTRQVVVDREDQTTDSTDEIQALLESVAVSFLLFPQAALTFVLKAKNILQQIVQADLNVVSYLLKAVGDVNNPDDTVTDTSDLVEAQSALVEVDRIGKVGQDIKAYDRYSAAVNRFLTRKLGPSLKRRRKNEFERSGTEARQDLFRVLSGFGPTHSLVDSRLTTLSKSVSSFQSVDLARIVATVTINRVRTSLQKILNGLRSNRISKTVAALELMSGAAALKSISGARQIYDPTVKTGQFPSGRTLSVFSEPVAATSVGSSSSVSLAGISTPWTFTVQVDAQSTNPATYNVVLPYTGASGRSWVSSKRANDAAPFNIPTGNKTLYIQLEGLTPPAGQPVLIKTVTLPTGVQTLSALVTAINAVLGADATCVELAPGSNRFLIYGSSSVTKIVMRTTVPGTFDISNNYVPAAASANTVLGFQQDQASGDPNSFTPSQLTDILGEWIPRASFSVESGASVIRSLSTSITSGLTFSGQVAAAFGFASATPNPSYLVLKENGVEVDPASVGIFVGSIVTALDTVQPPVRDITKPVSSIDGNHLHFAAGVAVPRCDNQPVTITAPIVSIVQALLSGIRSSVGSFSSDAANLQRVLSPLLSQPTLAQVNDATRVLTDIQSRLNTLMSALRAAVVTDDQSEFAAVAENIVSSFEERGLDRPLDLLNQGDFGSFFALTGDVSSSASRFMRAMENVASTDFPTTVVESQIPDRGPRGTTPDKNINQGTELSDKTGIR